MSSDHTPLQYGALDAEYEIIRELGRGGTALVYLARERATGTEVAIKLIHSQYAQDEEALARFAREARFVTQLDHENIVPLRAVVDLGNGGIALVMAHVAGRTLRQVIRAEGRLSPARAEQIMRDIGRALSAAHVRGIVHRDVKPENIFIDDDGRALLADFGVARSMTTDTQLTLSGVAIGTPAYMPPEQIESGGLDARGDVYSLGLVTWEMLTGHRPWDGQSLYSVLYHQKHEVLPDVRDVRDDVPDRLAEVILRAIEKDRAARWPDMRCLLDGLDQSVEPRPVPRRATPSAETTRFVRPPTPVALETLAAPPVMLSSVEATPVTLAAQPVMLSSVEATPVTLAPLAAPPVMLSSVDATPVTLAPLAAPPVMLSSVEATPRSIADEFEGRRLSSALSRHRTAVLGTVSALVLIAVVSLAAAAMRGRFAQKPARSPAAAPQFVAADVVKPVQMGAVRVDAQAVADSARRAAKDVVSDGAVGRASQPATVTIAPLPSVPALNLAAALQLGGPPPPAATPSTSTASIAIPPPPPASASVVAGGMHSCFKNADGRASCWGNNERGQVGSADASRPAPLLVGPDVSFAMVTAGLAHNCGITRDGAAWCWGNNDHRQLGERSAGTRSGPVRSAQEHTFRAIAAGAAHTCGLDATGVVWCWGANSLGQLGDTVTRDTAVPVPVGAGETRFVSIAAGWNFTCGITANGQAVCWGENSSGQLGDATTSPRRRPARVQSDVVFRSLAAGSAHACGVTAQGEVYCWGRNTNGQLGDGANVDRPAPVRVRGNAGFTSIATGAAHTCGVADDGTAYCWGRNTYGQLGNGTDVDQSQPARVWGGHTFGSVHAFGSHTCGATVSGQAFCWGYNLEGQLGDGTRIHRPHPVFVETPARSR